MKGMFKWRSKLKVTYMWVMKDWVVLIEGVQASHNSTHSDQYEPYHEPVEVSISTGENYVIIFIFRVIQV
jgi:hypothetical protein